MQLCQGLRLENVRVTLGTSPHRKKTPQICAALESADPTHSFQFRDEKLGSSSYTIGLAETVVCCVDLLRLVLIFDIQTSMYNRTT